MSNTSETFPSPQFIPADSMKTMANPPPPGQFAPAPGPGYRPPISQQPGNPQGPYFHNQQNQQQQQGQGTHPDYSGANGNPPTFPPQQPQTFQPNPQHGSYGQPGPMQPPQQRDNPMGPPMMQQQQQAPQRSYPPNPQQGFPPPPLPGQQPLSSHPQAQGGYMGPGPNQHPNMQQPPMMQTGPPMPGGLPPVQSPPGGNFGPPPLSQPQQFQPMGHQGGSQPNGPYYPQGQMGPQRPGFPPQQFQAQQPQPPQQMGNAPYGQSALPPQSQQKKLDPEHMPSAIGVMAEDQASRGGNFQTGAKGTLPPLVTTKFTVEDVGNASPRFVRSTMYSVPSQPDMLKQTAIPFALVVNPFESPAKDEQQLMCVDLGPSGPVRCIRCKAYMSPLMQFIDGGRRFQCLLCKATTEVPPEYFQHLDHTGNRVDKWERPELWKGSYEFVATTEYCRNNVLPKEPAFIFVLDVSYNNVKSGLVHLLCSHMKSLIENIPPSTPIGFITYSSKVHFYNLDKSLSQPQMVVVPDVADMFMPLLKGFLVPREEAGPGLENLMATIPAMFADSKETEAVLGPAIQAGMEALKASERVGKLLIFHSSLPTSEVAPGKLKNREADRKLLGTDKEKTVLTPQGTFYNTLGQECVSNGTSVDLYLFNNSYIDVATVGQVARTTGGSIYKYTYFQADVDGSRVIGDLSFHLSRPMAFDGVMRVRTSTGVRPTDFHGHFYMANTTDVELAVIDSNKGISIEIKHDDKLGDDDSVFIQIALLYTSLYGQRRLRIHNLTLSTCSQMADLYRNCELDTLINFLAKQAISRSIESTPQAIKEGITNRCAQMLATYRKHCANPSMPGQLILPECLKLLPLFVNCVLRSDAVSGGSDLTPDDRSWLMYTVMTMGVGTSVHYFYPKLYQIGGPGVPEDSPTPIRSSHDKLREDSAFLLENGIYIFLWVGSAISPDWLKDIFGVTHFGQLNAEQMTELPDINSDDSLRLRGLIRSLRNERNRHMRLAVVKAREKMELVMNRFLVEDRTGDGFPSYVDFLCHMHKEIRAILNQ